MPRDDHLVGKKQRDHYQKSLREHVSAPTSAFAKAQLEKMGWSEGTGLGKRRDGRAEHIRVTRRQEQLGLGSSGIPEVVQAMGQTEWWKDSLGRTLAKLDSKKKEKKSKDRDKKKDGKSSGKKQKKEKKLHYTDEELFEATGGARFGMRAGVTKNLHKWTRTEQLRAETDNNNSSTESNTASVDNGGNTCGATKQPRPSDENPKDADGSKEEKEQHVEPSIRAKKDKKERKDKRRKEYNTSLNKNEGARPKNAVQQQPATKTATSSEEVTVTKDAKAPLALEDDKSSKAERKKKRKAAKKERQIQKKQRT